MHGNERCQRPLPSRRVAGALILITALAADFSTVRGQPTVANASEAQKERARANYERAKEAYQADRYEEALDGFQTSYDNVASPNSKLMIARSLRGLGRNAEAYHSYEDTVREGEQWGDNRYDEAAAAAAEEMAKLKANLAMLRVDIGDPSGEATLTLNDRTIDRRRWDGPVAAEPGPTVVVLQAPDGRRADHRLTLEAGVAAAIELTLPAPEPVATAPPSPKPQVAVTSGAHAGMRTAAYVAGGVGVAALGAFAVLAIMSQGEFDDLEKACPTRMACEPSLADTADTGKTLQTGANVALVLGAVGVGAGAVLFVLSMEDEQTEVTVGAGHIGVRGAL